MNNQTKNVFISHVHENDDGLGKLKALLENSGMNIRDYSINSSNPNNAKDENYIKHQILAPRINDCSTLLVYITPQTKQSAYVNWEIEYAQKLGKRIVGVWAHGEHGCDLPQALADLADSIVVGWNGECIIDAINGESNIWQDPTGAPSTAVDIRRYSC